MGIGEFVKRYYREVVLPSVVTVALVSNVQLIPYIYANGVAGIEIPFRSDYSISEVDTDGDGRLDTRIITIPRAGTLREKINSE